MTTRTQPFPTAAEVFRTMPVSDLENLLAKHYNTTVGALYERITGQPMWRDAGAPGQRYAAATWLRFVESCRTSMIGRVTA